MQYSHAIITYSGVHYLITAQEEELLRNKKLGDEFEIEGSTIKVNNIADVLTTQKYYETYPDKRPPVTNRLKELPGIGMGGLIQTSREKALKGITGGLKKFLSDKPDDECKSAREMLALAEKRLTQINN